MSEEKNTRVISMELALKGADDEDGSQPLGNTRHEAFVVLLVEGKPPTEAILEVYPSASNKSSSTSYATALMRRRDVALRLRWLQNRVAEQAILSRDELAAYLSDVIRTPIGKVDENSKLAQELVEDVSGDGVISSRLKMPGKIEAARELARIMGYNAPEKQDATVRVAPEASIIAALRQVQKLRDPVIIDVPAEDVREELQGDTTDVN